MLEGLDWLESTALSMAIRQSLWLYPGLEVVHILGIVLLVGPALMFDLRLLGFSKELSIVDLSRLLLPWSQRGLLLIVPSGLLLFITNAKSLGVNPTFWFKMGLLAIAGVNVFLFHRYIFKTALHFEEKNRLPHAAKISAVVSILVWTAVIAFGRWLAY